MAKNEQKGSITAKITDSLNKRGEIKGRNKKETKNLKAMCMHHKYTKKGKLRPEIINDGAGKCTCTMCTHSFSTEIKKKEKVKEDVNKTMALVDQAKFICASADLGGDTEKYLARLSVDLMHFPKVYEKSTRIALKNENIKKKKKGNNNRGFGSESYGSWS